MLEKPCAQNIAAFENESKRRELTDHWKSIKLFLKKKVTRDDAKKDKNDNWNKSFNRRFPILQNQI